MYVCVREREREQERGGGGRERDGEQKLVLWCKCHPSNKCRFKAITTHLSFLFSFFLRSQSEVTYVSDLVNLRSTHLDMSVATGLTRSVPQVYFSIDASRLKSTIF